MSNRLTADNFGGLSGRQMEILRRNAPTAEDILNNEEYMEELSEEIVTNYNQDEAVELAAEDRTLTGGDMPTPAKSTHRRKAPPNKKPAKAPPAPAPAPRTVAPVQTVGSLDDELAALEAKADALRAERAAQAAVEAEATETPQEVVEEQPMTREERIRQDIFRLLHAAPDAPTEAQIANWKKQFGKNAVNVVAFGDDDVYVYTHLTRGQWSKIQRIAAKTAETNPNADPEDTLREKVLQHTILWPTLKLEFFYSSRAGLIDALYDVIMLNSYFLAPQQTMQLTTQL